jgi:aryl-alcohol dehydrogenase-like predicted oxidoreductase
MSINVLVMDVQAIEGIRDKVQVGTTFSFYTDGKGKSGIRGDPEHVRASCEGSLKRLGIDCIDLFYQHRIDTKVPIEVTVSTKPGPDFTATW